LVKLITNGVVSGLSGFEDYNYDSSRRKQVKDYFKNNDNDFQSFSDLLKIAKEYKKPKTPFQPVQQKPKTTQPAQQQPKITGV